MKKALCVIIVILFFTGCAGTNNDKSDSGGVSDSRSAQETADDSGGVPDAPDDNGGYPTPEELRELFPGKEVLVWVTSYEFNVRTAESVVRLNEALSGMGKDYVVCFKPMKYEMFHDENSLYRSAFAENVMSYIDGGGQADLISAESYFMHSVNAPMLEFVKGGYLCDLEEFMKTEKGREIYDAYPPIFWKSCEVEHGLYGMMMGAVMGGGVYNYYDKALADKYGLDMETMSLPPHEMTEIYKEIYDEETKSNPDFKVMSESVAT
ncbi:MAG: hypothetical protein LBI36_02230, partial [Oscillospiraceae bacterium]|nr:hypothetical protein [Oscillospiraceae bacterium]